MRTSSDQFVKNALKEALIRIGEADVEVEFPGAVQKIDVFCTPDPARDSVRREMGLLGELAEGPTMFEPHSNTPQLGHARRCLRKQLAWDHERKRRARAQARNVRVETGDAEASDPDPDDEAGAKELPFPRLVVLSTGRPGSVLGGYGLTATKPGVYRAAAAPALALWLVVLSELPRTRETLFLRLFGDEEIQSEAIEEMLTLPRSAWELLAAGEWKVHLSIGPFDNCSPRQKKVMENATIIWKQYKEERARLEAALAEAAADREQVTSRVLARKLGRALSLEETGALRQRLKTLGPDRIVDVAFDLDPEALAAWLADPAAV